MLSEYAGIIFPEGATSVSMDELAEAAFRPRSWRGAGIVLGILALLGVHPVF